MNLANKVMIKKDRKTFFSNKQVIVSVCIVSFVFCILYPLVMSLAVAMTPEDELVEIIKEFSIISSISENITRKEAFQFIFMILGVFVLIIPIMLGNILGGTIISYEKENKTLETILYSPIKIKDFFMNKLLSTYIPGLLVSWLAGALCLICVNAVSLSVNGIFVTPSLSFVIETLLFGPSILFFVTVLSLKISAKNETSIKSQQKSAGLVLPVMLGVMLISSLTMKLGGIISVIVLLGVSLLLFIIGYIIYSHIAKNMTAEKLIG